MTEAQKDRMEIELSRQADIELEVADRTLTIRVNAPKENAGDTAADRVERTLTLGDAILADKASAKHENGVLTITLPKREEAKPRKVTVEVK